MGKNPSVLEALLAFMGGAAGEYTEQSKEKRKITAVREEAKLQREHETTLAATQQAAEKQRLQMKIDSDEALSELERDARHDLNDDNIDAQTAMKLLDVQAQFHIANMGYTEGIAKMKHEEYIQNMIAGVAGLDRRAALQQVYAQKGEMGDLSFNSAEFAGASDDEKMLVSETLRRVARASGNAKLQKLAYDEGIGLLSKAYPDSPLLPWIQNVAGVASGVVPPNGISGTLGQPSGGGGPSSPMGQAMRHFISKPLIPIRANNSIPDVFSNALSMVLSPTFPLRALMGVGEATYRPFASPMAPSAPQPTPQPRGVGVRPPISPEPGFDMEANMPTPTFSPELEKLFSELEVMKEPVDQIKRVIWHKEGRGIKGDPYSYVKRAPVPGNPKAVAIGPYQLHSPNLKKWGEDFFGKPLTVAEVKGNAKLQEALVDSLVLEGLREGKTREEIHMEWRGGPHGSSKKSARNYAADAETLYDEVERRKNKRTGRRM